MNFTSSEIVTFLIIISLMLFVARGLGELLRLIKQPIIIGEIIAGILLGPTLLGTLAPEMYNKLFVSSSNISTALQGITTLAVIMLMLVSGLEVNLNVVLRQGKVASITSLMGVVFPFVLGFGFAYLFPESLGIMNINDRLVFSLFIGTALSITALPVVARTLMDLNLFKSEIGFIIIASAMFNDLIGWIIFSVLLGMVGAGSHGFSFTTTVILTFSFILIVIFVGRKLINRTLPFIQKRTAFPGGVLNLIFILGFLGAAFTEYIGIHAIFGAFIMGIAIGDSASLKEDTREIIHQFVTNIFAPLFFVSIGLRVNFIASFDLAIVSLFIILAFAGKVIGCSLGSYWGGLNKNDSLAVGFGMNSRGAMEIVLGILALQFGLIQEKVFVALVIMALITSISSAPLMSIFLSERKKINFRNLISSKNIYFSSALNKKEMILELAEKAASEFKLSKDEIFKSVWEREEFLPTGIANYLAIPHSKMNIKKPVVYIAVNKTGLDFSAMDNLPARVIVLLLTPKDNNELQLKLLAEIALAFKDNMAIEKLLESQTQNEFYSGLKLLAEKEKIS